MRQPRLRQRLHALPLNRVLAAGVELRSAAGQMAHHRVEQDVARPGLEARGIRRPTAGRQKDDARRRPKVQQYPALARTAEQEIIGERRQRNALTAGGHVAATEVADGGDAAALGHDGGHAQRQRGRKTAFGIVPDGVAGTADDLHLLQAEAGLVGDGAGGGGEGLAEQPVQQADFAGLAGAEPDTRRIRSFKSGP